MSIVKACDIYIPNENIDKEKWAVVACDQYTSEEQYWEEVKEFVGEEPSTLKVIYPEVYLEEDKEKKVIKNVEMVINICYNHNCKWGFSQVVRRGSATP